MQEKNKLPRCISRPELGKLFDPVDRWVLICVVVEYTGYTDDAVRAKIRRGDWPYRSFWRKAPDGRVVFNLSQIQRWMSCIVS
jgi:hypothetical protein